LEKGEAPLGSFSTVDLYGNAVTESVFQGKKLTMIHCWATFCNPCVEEMPTLAELQREYGESFQVIGIVVDAADPNGVVRPEKKAEAISIAESTQGDYFHLLPSGDLYRNYLSGVQAVPETVFLEENGNLIGGRYLGARSKGEWKRIIDAILESLE